MNTTVPASSSPLHIVLAPLGSEGDLIPFLWLADKLTAAGHRVTIVANPFFASRVAGTGHAFLPAGDESAQRALLDNAELWQGMKGSLVLLRATIDQLAAYAAPLLEPSLKADLVLGSGLAIGAACAAEARGIPFVRVHLQPVVIRSNQRPPLLAPNLAWLRRLPAPFVRAFFGLVDRSLDGAPLRGVNAFRRTLGLADWRSFYRDAVCGGDAACGLFPAWFAEPPKDWPAHLRCFDFPHQHRTPARPLSDELQRFLAAGEAPVLWTHGSANRHTEEFARAAERCSRELGVRGILVAPTEDAAAQPGSDRFLRLAYAPFESLLPRCRALVHHGGIGTMAEGLRAGLPQLIVPQAHDQFDNADHAARLGFGLVQRYRTLAHATPQLGRLLAGEHYAARARALGAQIADRPDIVPWLEAVHRDSHEARRAAAAARRRTGISAP